jgi:DNA-binding beta-propeller fold protein YncE
VGTGGAKGGAYAVAITPNGKTAYCLNNASAGDASSVTPISTATNKPVGRSRSERIPSLS